MELEPLSGQRQKNETDNAVIACNDYLRLGPARSLAKLLDRYQTVTNSPPSTRITTLKDWSRKFGWQERASEFDASWELRKTAEREAELTYGLALDYERIRKLKRLADFLESQIYEIGTDGDYHNVWLPDVKQIGRGKDAERVDIERFNAALFDQYRGILDDLAKEVGGRIRKAEIETKDWRSDAIESIRNQEIEFEPLATELGEDLANELFALAGVPIAISREN